MRKHARKTGRGFTLVEVLVTVGLAAVMLTAYSTMITNAFFLRRSQYNIMAANIIQEELDSLRSIPLEDLTTRTDGAFLGMPVQRGAWVVAEDNGDGHGNRMSLPAAVPAITGETGLVVVPGNYREDFTFTAKIKVDPSAPTGWGAGLAFRYRDAENHYRLRFTSGGVTIDKVSRGAVVTNPAPWNSSGTYAKGTWYEFTVTAANNVISVTRNGTLLGTWTDTKLPYFLSGDLALASYAGSPVSFDDVAVTENAVTTTWDFEADGLGEIPYPWQRVGYGELPGGNGTISIEDYLGEPTMKQVTVNVSWVDGGRTKSVQSSTIIDKN